MARVSKSSSTSNAAGDSRSVKAAHLTSGPGYREYRRDDFRRDLKKVTRPLDKRDEAKK
jgi:hypothetical protein